MHDMPACQYMILRPENMKCQGGDQDADSTVSISNAQERMKKMSQYVIKARNLTKTYGDFAALNQVDIQVKKGEIYGLVGDNGAGKTTFIKLMAGLIYPTEGEIQLFGRHLPGELEQQRRRTGVIIEAPGFYPQLTVEQNMEYYRRQKGIPDPQSVYEILELVGLADKRKKKCRELSMGMKQRLGLAIALIGEPELLLLDEPINGLDPSGIIEIRGLLRKLNQEKRITIVLSSHILSELEQLATVYGFLSHGRLVEQISAEKLKEKCEEYIEIQVSDSESYAVFLEKELKQEEYQVLPDGVVRIYHPTCGIESFSHMAGAHQIDILRLEKCQSTLEEYYMKLKEGGR